MKNAEVIKKLSGELELSEAEVSRLNVKVLDMAIDCADAYMLMRRCMGALTRLPTTAFDEHIKSDIAAYIRRIETKTGKLNPPALPV